MIGTNDPEMAEACRRFVGCSSRTLGLQVREAVETSMMAVFIRPSLYWLPARLPFLKLGHSWFDPAFEVSRMSDFQYAVFSHLLPNLKALQPLRRNKPLVCAMLLMGCLFDSCGPAKETRGRFCERRYSCPIGSLKNAFYLNCAAADSGHRRISFGFIAIGGTAS